MRTVLIGLTLTKGIGWKTIQRLILSGLDPHCWNMTTAQWKKHFPFLSSMQAHSLHQKMNKDAVLQQIERYHAQNIGTITVEDDTYPTILKEGHEPPWVLFYKGEKALLAYSSLAVVGSRKTSTYGRVVTEKIVQDLVKQGWTIVSGLAMGIDAVAHETALHAAGKTIGVLGCGVDITYPKTNRRLYQQIELHGLLLSEYVPGTSPHPGYFPRRNRIIAGLSYGVIVTEAAKRSGSLLTAHLALESGREVFSVPGSIFEPQSVGTNVLIQHHGAKLITNTSDITNELKHVQPSSKWDSSERVDSKEKGNSALKDDEQAVLAHIELGKQHINDLSHVTGFDVAALIPILLSLEMKGKVMALPGSYYQAATVPE